MNKGLHLIPVSDRILSNNMKEGRCHMKFIPLEPTGEALEKEALEQEFCAGRELAPVRFGAQHFFFKVRRKIYYIPYEKITRCFRRVELVDARMGCCFTALDMENIVICGAEEQELAQIRLSGGERVGKVVLETLQEKCPQAQIGYVRDPEQKTCFRTV